MQAIHEEMSFILAAPSCAGGHAARSAPILQEDHAAAANAPAIAGPGTRSHGPTTANSRGAGPLTKMHSSRLVLRAASPATGHPRCRQRARDYCPDRTTRGPSVRQDPVRKCPDRRGPASSELLDSSPLARAVSTVIEHPATRGTTPVTAWTGALVVRRSGRTRSASVRTDADQRRREADHRAVPLP